ncbi:MAG: helix-turn-helix transcriptional regulator [Gammaproteobacteria bacterium]
MNRNNVIQLLNRQSSRVSALCKPLRILGVDHFSVIKSYDQGKIINLSSLDNWVEAYYKERLYKTSLFEDFPGNYNSGMFYFPNEEDSDVVSFAQDRFDCFSCYTIIIRSHHHSDMYFFSMKEANKNNVQVYLNNTELLYKFIHYFNRKLSTTFSELLVDKSDLYDDLYVPSKVISGISKTSIKSFNSLISSKDNFLCEFPKITAREASCLKYLLMGLSAKEIADRMHITSRSVEFHVNNLKLKFDCRTTLALVSRIYSDFYEYAMSLRVK